MNLFPHNQEAYERVMSAFETTNRVAVVHATGTGKSYIIAAVAEHFNKVCIIAPNNFVLHETQKVCKDGTKFVTYASVMKKDGNIGHFDLIVLDEFHRSGAERWGDAVESLLANNADAKVLGTSATHIRYLDNMRDMAEEIFNNNIVSYLSLPDAIIRGILPKPTYVTALYSLRKDVERMRTLASGKKWASAEWRNDMVKKINRISENWENASGVSHVISKYIPKSTQRVIVFCASVEESNKMRSMIGRWFALAGFDHIGIIQIDYSSSQYEKKMDMFQQNDDRIKIALSVNMLNEGIHVPNVDAVIMLRHTSSRIITEQQIGRCLNAGEKRTPVVLDLVNNIDLITNFTDKIGTFEFETHESGSDRKNHNHRAVYFDVVDETKDIRDIFESLRTEIDGANWETKKAQFQAFYDEHGRLPYSKEDYLLHHWMCRLLKYGEPEQIKWLVEHGAKLVKAHNEYVMSMSYEEMVDYYEMLAEKYQNPSELDKNKTKEERRNLVSIHNQFNIHRDEISPELHERRKAITEKYGKLRSSEYWFDKILSYQKEHGCLSKLLLHKVSSLKNWGTWTDEFECELRKYGYRTQKEKEHDEWVRIAERVEELGSTSDDRLTFPEKRSITRMFGNSKKSENLRVIYPDVYDRISKYRDVASKRMYIDEALVVFYNHVKQTGMFPTKGDSAYQASRLVSKAIIKGGEAFYNEHKDVCDMFYSTVTNKGKRGAAYKTLDAIMAKNKVK